MKKPNERAEHFIIDLRRNLAGFHWNSLPNLGYFAVYNGPPDPRLPSRLAARLLFIARGLAGLRRRLTEVVQYPGHSLRSVFVETAASISELTDLDYERLKAGVFTGIAEFRRRGDRETLLRVRAALESLGGPRPEPASNDWIVQMLHQLAAGKLLKQAVHGPRKTGSASAQLGRFCSRFYGLCACLDADSPAAWQEPYVAGILTAQLGLIFPRDLAAAQEAYARGRKSQGRVRRPAQK